MLRIDQAIRQKFPNFKHRKISEGGWTQAHCPFHEDKTPSFSFKVANNNYRCHSCGRSGTVYEFLIDELGYEAKDAYVEAYGESGEPPKQKRKKSDKPKVWPQPLLYGKYGKREALHDYTDADGNTVFKVGRYPPGPGQIKTPPWHEVEGGWVMRLPPDLRKRPLYRLPQLVATDKSKQVVVVEGGKCADAFAEHFSNSTVTTWYGGAGNEHLTDWTPLHGYDLVLIADGDEEGREVMKRLAKNLHPHCPNIKLCLPPNLPKQENDIADWLAAGGGDEAKNRISEYSQTYQPPATQSAPTDEEKKSVDDLAKNEYFEILGKHRGAVITLLATSEIEEHSRANMMQPNTLLALAPNKNWWLDRVGSDGNVLTRAMAQNFGCELVSAADRIGQIDMSKVMGRGAFWDRGALVWNLGDRLLVDGKEKPLREHEGTFRPLSGPPIRLAPQAATLDERRAFCKAMLAFRWPKPLDGKRYMGWLVTSMIGGALDWRVHLWIVAPAGRGKSYLVSDVAQPILSDAYVKAADNTEPSMARQIGNDSLPVLLEEFEPDDKTTPALMKMIRLASGGDGSRGRAHGDKGFTLFHPRFSALLSSTKVAKLNQADASRIAMVGLRAEGVSDWNKVDSDIRRELRNADKFRTGIIRDTYELVTKIRDLSRKLIDEGMDTRKARITAALSVGFSWWSGIDEVLQLETTTDDPEVSDAFHLLWEILGFRLRTQDGRDISAMRLLATEPGSELCKDYGLRVMGSKLLIAHQHPALLKKLKGTGWERVDIGKELRQIEGAQRTQQHFGNNSRWAAVSIPLDVLVGLGIDLASIEDDEDSQQGVPF